MVANKHYWQVTPEDFERAIQGSSKAAHNPAQHLHVSARTDSQTPPTAHKKTPLLPVPALPCETVPKSGYAPARTRTLNPLIKSQMLCQLSYRGDSDESVNSSS